MILKRIVSASAAVIMALSMAAVTVSAEEEKEPQLFEITADAEKLSPDGYPALSFDSENFKDYIHLSRDSEKAGLKISHDRDTYYQGASARISADSKGVEGYTPISGMVRDADNNLLYPDAPEDEETDKMSIMGVELNSEDFSLSSFNGCTFYFAYRLTDEDSDALLGSSVWVYPTDDNYVRLDNPLQLKVNTALDDNVTQYRKAVITVPAMTTEAATKFIFEIPCVNKMKGNVLYLDNIIIELPDDFGNNRFVKNIDNYNAKAEPREIIEELQIKDNKQVEKTDTTVDKQSDKINPVSIIVVVVVVIGIAVAAVIIIKKMKNRFY
ncbi:MAG: hypothetical protein ACI4JW_10160 [Oscillospiraceae bacterium]